jgi:hypothetical protein
VIDEEGAGAHAGESAIGAEHHAAQIIIIANASKDKLCPPRRKGGTGGSCAAMDRNLYDASDEEMKSLPTVCSSLRQALDALEKDHAFLTQGDVFSKGMIESYIAMKMDEIIRAMKN